MPLENGRLIGVMIPSMGLCVKNRYFPASLSASYKENAIFFKHSKSPPKYSSTFAAAFGREGKASSETVLLFLIDGHKATTISQRHSESSDHHIASASSMLRTKAAQADLGSGKPISPREE
jgi:hypothetical protein